MPRIFVAEETLGGRDDLDATMGPRAEKPLDSYWLKKAVDYTASKDT